MSDIKNTSTTAISFIPQLVDTDTKQDSLFKIHNDTNKFNNENRFKKKSKKNSATLNTEANNNISNIDNIENNDPLTQVNKHTPNSISNSLSNVINPNSNKNSQHKNIDLNNNTERSNLKETTYSVPINSFDPFKSSEKSINFETLKLEYDMIKSNLESCMNQKNNLLKIKEFKHQNLESLKAYKDTLRKDTKKTTSINNNIDISDTNNTNSSKFKTKRASNQNSNNNERKINELLEQVEEAKQKSIIEKKDLVFKLEEENKIFYKNKKDELDNNYDELCFENQEILNALNTELVILKKEEEQLVCSRRHNKELKDLVQVSQLELKNLLDILYDKKEALNKCELVSKINSKYLNNNNTQNTNNKDARDIDMLNTINTIITNNTLTENCNEALYTNSNSKNNNNNDNDTRKCHSSIIKELKPIKTNMHSTYVDKHKKLTINSMGKVNNNYGNRSVLSAMHNGEETFSPNSNYNYSYINNKSKTKSSFINNISEITNNNLYNKNKSISSVNDDIIDKMRVITEEANVTNSKKSISSNFNLINSSNSKIIINKSLANNNSINNINLNYKQNLIRNTTQTNTTTILFDNNSTTNKNDIIHKNRNNISSYSKITNTMSISKKDNVKKIDLVKHFDLQVEDPLNRIKNNNTNDTNNTIKKESYKTEKSDNNNSNKQPKQKKKLTLNTNLEYNSSKNHFYPTDVS